MTDPGSRFLREVPLERARLALEDPDGERDAVAPLSQFRAYQMLVEGGEQPLNGHASAVPLSSISTDSPPPMLVDRLDPLGHTILYGTGGVGKGALACWWIVQLVRAGHRVLIADYEKHPEEWSRRIAALDPDTHAGNAVWHMAPEKPLSESATALAIVCDTMGLDVVVIDSAVMACGTDPLKPDAPAIYGRAVLDIGRPTLSLAHVTKADDARYPFGSVFWHNLARTTWGLQADQSGAVILTHRKHNNYARLGRFQITQTWHDGRLVDVAEKPYGVALKDRLREVLEAGPMTLDEIMESLNDGEFDGVPVLRNSVRKALTRDLVKTFRLSQGRYEVQA